MAYSSVGVKEDKHPLCISSSTGKGEKGKRRKGKKDAKSEEGQCCKERDIADQWLHIKVSFCSKKKNIDGKAGKKENGRG